VIFPKGYVGVWYLKQIWLPGSSPLM
jgi:hypothetical protein